MKPNLTAEKTIMKPEPTRAQLILYIMLLIACLRERGIDPPEPPPFPM